MSLMSFSATLGIVFLLYGIPMVLQPKATSKWVLSVLKDDFHCRIIGTIFTVLAALTLMFNGYMIGSDPEGLITLVALLTFAKGVMAAWFPAFAYDMKKRWYANESLQIFGGIIATVLGAVFIWWSSLV